MANTPKIRSKEQIIGDLIDGIAARLGPGYDLNRGSVLSQILESVGQNIFKSSADIITMLDALSVDRATGEALQRLANDKNVPILSSQPSTGKVDVTDTSITKISTTVYSGQPAPVAGSLIVYVTDASKFNASGGAIYLGRGTLNVEGPLNYTSVQAESGGAYWSITLAPTSPTTKFHNIGESVILSQGGNRTINPGTTVQTSQLSSSTQVSFSTTAIATIIDGEVTVTDVPVKCKIPGTSGNVPKGAIKEIVGLPFVATVTNNFAFSNGRLADTEDDIKARIKAYEQAKAKGTEQAIKLAAIGVVAQDELKKVQSSSVIRNSDNSASLVFDDGGGYEPNFVGMPFETVIDSAIGGEREVQIRQRPLAQARLKNINKSPYPIENYSYLTVEIDGVELSHQFLSSDFKVPSSATAFEIISSINGNPNIHFLASTSEDGSKIVIYPKDRTKNDIKIKTPTTGTNANDSLGFAKNIEYTIRLYKNDQPLHQDGVVAKVSTRNKSTWSSSISSGETLIYTVDNTPAITATFNLSDFQNIDQNSIVSYNTDINLWAQVMNNIMPGVKALVNGSTIDLYSNRGAVDEARIEIVGGTLKDKIFEIGVAIFKEGKKSDYSFNKQTGQLTFTEPLSAGDKITAGSQYTRANLYTSPIPFGPGTAGRVWMLVDGNSKSVANNLKPNTQVKFLKSGTKLTIIGENNMSLPEGFDLAQPGDWVLVWANASDPSQLQSNQGFWRIESCEEGEIVVDDGTTVRSNLNSFFTPITDRIVIVRSEAPMQLLSYPASSLADFVDEINSQIIGINAEIIGSKVRISTKSFNDENGELYIVAVDQAASALELPTAEAYNNVSSHFGYTVSTDSDAGIPSFVHGTLGASITDDQFTEPNYLLHAGSEDDIVEILDKYDTSTTSIIEESNKNRRAFVKDYDVGLNRLYLSVPNYLKTGKSLIQQDDRYFLRSSYKFAATDSISTVLDADNVLKSFKMPVSRKLTVSNHSTPTTQDFSANDSESSLDLDDQASFYDFDFNSFKVFRQSQKILTNGTYSLKFKSVDYGPAGDKIRVGFKYPTSIGQTALSSQFSVSDVIDAAIILPVKTARTPNWDNTTSFTVSKSTVGGKDTITYTYRSGLEPDFTNTGADVHVGDIAIISSDANFLSGNRNIQGRVISFTATSFTIEVPTNGAINDNLASSNFVNQNGFITVTTPTAHNIVTGQRVGFWNTATSDGMTYPFNETYIATVLSPTQFKVDAPVAAPGGLIQSATHVSNIITVTTAVNHGLSVNNVILISAVSVGSYDGLATVSAVLSPNQFQIIKSGSSSPISNLGRFDFQSFLPSTVANISTIFKTGNLVTANTSTAHGLTPGDIVNVQAVVLDTWSNVTNYNPGDLVRYSGQNYVSLSVNVNKQPNVNPADWQTTALDLTGYYIVDTTPTANQFKYYYSQSGSTGGTSGTSTKQISTASIARSLGGSTSSNLEFGLVETTAQEVADYVSVNLSNKLTTTITNANPSALINISTEDLDLGSNYISTSIISTQRYKGSRKVTFRTAALIAKGASIKVTGLTALSAYNGSYIVIDSYYDSNISQNVAIVQSSIIANNDYITVDAGIILGSLPYKMLEDGENSIDTNNLASLISVPMFTTKHLWNNAPEIGENLYLVAVNAEQLNRFWNKLIVTGFSNLGKIELSQYGRDLQLSTNTFGNKGSVQVSGGTANEVTLAVVNSGADLSKLGHIQVPYDIRHGLISNQWIKLYNTVRQNKTTGFSSNTNIKMWADGLEIISGTGTFQTIRPTTQNANTKIKIEKHGNFVAFISVSGTSFGLSTAGVKEGDRVKIRNVDAAAWSSATTYSSGQIANFNGLNYTSLQNSNLNNNPETTTGYWEVREFTSTNEGIFQIIRTFGEDTFWIENANAIEEFIQLGNAGNIVFYSHDSVMPGDNLLVETDIFGAQNIGRYVVVDETVAPTYSFPNSTRIWTETIQSPPVNPFVLGGDYGRVNIEEESPTKLWKRIFTSGPGDGGYANILVDSPELISKISSSLGAVLEAQGKLAFDQDINFGVDAYRYYIGLIKELNKIIYGDPADTINYPGIRAGGTAIDIKGSIVKRIKASISVRVKTGVPFSEVGERVKASVAGYVNSLGVGESVSISRMVAAANVIPGIVSVAVTYPTYNSSNDLIPVGADEKAFVIDPVTDITISLINN